MIRRVPSLLRSLLRPTSAAAAAASSRYHAAASPFNPVARIDVLTSPPLPASLLTRNNSSILFSRSFVANPDDNQNLSRVTSLKTSDEAESLMKKARDDNVPMVFYYTAAWCGPCKLISPLVNKLSMEYPNISFYKMDIDEDGLSRILCDLRISSVLTFHFFQGGMKSEHVGANAEQLRLKIKNLYMTEGI